MVERNISTGRGLKRKREREKEKEMVKEREIEKERVQLYQRCRTEPNLIEGGAVLGGRGKGVNVRSSGFLLLKILNVGRTDGQLVRTS